MAETYDVIPNEDSKEDMIGMECYYMSRCIFMRIRKSTGLLVFGRGKSQFRNVPSWR